MRDFLGANGSPLLCVVAFFSPPAACAGVLEPLQKWVCHVWSIDLFQLRGSAHFFLWLSYACAYRREQKNATTHNGGEPFAPGEDAHRFSLP